MDREKLESALLLLDSLISDETAEEDDFQKWFEAHPVVFKAYGYQQAIPHPHLKDRCVNHYPDFMAQKIDGLWEIVELKRPDTQILKDSKKRRAFYSALDEYYIQCREYSEFFDEAENRETFDRIRAEPRGAAAHQGTPGPHRRADRPGGLPAVWADSERGGGGGGQSVKRKAQSGE